MLVTSTPNAMALDLSLLESRYHDACRRKETLPNSSILSAFSKAVLRESHKELCILEIFLDHLTHSDFPPLVDAFSMTDLSGIDAVDIRQESPGVSFNGQCVLSLLRSIYQRLRIVDLLDWSFWKDVLRDLSQGGLTCQILNLRFSPIRKLNMTGAFLQLHTLNLDFSISLTSFREGCFSCMPNLMRLSMCETKITNLWTTSAVLSKLPSLIELRFQNCLCCYDTGPCPTSSDGEAISVAHRKINSGHQHLYTYGGSQSIASEDFIFQNMQYPDTEEVFINLFPDDDSYTNNELLLSAPEDSSDESEFDYSSNWHAADTSTEMLSDSTGLGGQNNPENEVNHYGHSMSFNGSSSILHSVHFPDAVLFQNNHEGLEIPAMDVFKDLSGDPSNDNTTLGESSTSIASTLDKDACLADLINLNHSIGSTGFGPRKYISHHPSPICFEKYYREYMITSLPRLRVLDNLPIKNAERVRAKIVSKQYYEYLPYNRQFKESVFRVLQKREMGGNSGMWNSPKSILQCTSAKNSYSYTRSLSSAKVASSPWPHFHPVSKFKNISREGVKGFRPRQFEYHPSNPSLMVFGTLDGELVVINHESGKIVGYLSSAGALHSILGLCWLKKHPSKLIAGSDNGSLQLYDICHMPSIVIDRYCSMDAATCIYDEFEQLTSVHVNSTDDKFLASGYSKHVALYDIESGRSPQLFRDLHQEHINVVKFAHHSPNIFATSSFDKEVKMWDLRQGVSHPCYSAQSSRGNVMVCFSPDDQYLLSSAVDNEVKQLLAVDGRLHMKFNIASIGSAQNYTRSYYMNGRDYIISGSCEENVVRICCTQTGRRLRDISLEGRGLRNSIFVQSLRGDPFRDFHMSVLAGYLRPSSKSEIIKVNLLGSSDSLQSSFSKSSHSSYGMGG
ncbi:hypothetical protein QJS10_CPA05g01262 [Acorus calamus]|uniref:DWD hypersensitive to UV-B 1 N-terminal domain-containing protein n=1 Tax=Acorus calamus TaxID=4465 RepID=A0AAV9ET71_ACOCL|nr:hypothetical protein QJS10_CPA05g01262 [Acorus calamus]